MSMCARRRDTHGWYADWRYLWRYGDVERVRHFQYQERWYGYLGGCSGQPRGCESGGLFLAHSAQRVDRDDYAGVL